MPSHVDVEERVARVPLLTEMLFDQVWTFVMLILPNTGNQFATILWDTDTI